MRPGMGLRVQTPAGVMSVVIPHGVEGGDSMMIRYPTSQLASAEESSVEGLRRQVRAYEEQLSAMAAAMEQMDARLAAFRGKDDHEERISTMASAMAQMEARLSVLEDPAIVAARAVSRPAAAAGLAAAEASVAAVSIALAAVAAAAQASRTRRIAWAAARRLRLRLQVAARFAQAGAERKRSRAAVVTVHLKFLTGQTVTLQLTGGSTVATLKHQLARQLPTSMPTACTRILFDGRELDAWTSLADSGLRGEATVHVVSDVAANKRNAAREAKKEAEREAASRERAAQLAVFQREAAQFRAELAAAPVCLVYEKASLFGLTCQHCGATRREHSPEGAAEQLLEVVARGDAAELRCLLLTRRPNLNARNPDAAQQTALHVAVKRAKVEVTRLLLLAGADPVARDAAERTPLHLATNADVTRLLLRAAADPAARDARGRTPLDNAKFRVVTPQVTQLLLQAEAATRKPRSEVDSVGVGVPSRAA